MKFKTSLASIFAAASVLAAAPAAAQEWPNKPVKIVVGFPAGTSTDIVARIYADKLREHFKQPFIIENRPGASGAIAAAAVAAAPADGYTLYVATIANAIGQNVFKNVKVDIREDFVAIASPAATPSVLVVSPKVPVKSVKELTDYAKERPGQVFYASGGAGTAPHLVAEQFNQRNGTKLVHVPYKSLAEGINDLISGRITVMFAPLPAVSSFIGSGQVKPLAVASAKRTQIAPDTPTFAELGYQQFEADIWYGFMAAKNTPAAIVTAVAEELNRANNDPETRKRLASTGAIPTPSTPQSFTSFVRADVAKWKAVVDAADIKID